VEHSEENRKTYNSISEDWDLRRRSFDMKAKEFLQRIPNKTEAKMADVGCGTGRHLELAVSLGFKTNNLFGLDFSQGQLALVKEKGFNPMLCSMLSLPFEDGFFDAALCIASLHHFLDYQDQLAACREIFRVIKPGSSVLFSVWHPDKKYVAEQERKGKFSFITEKKAIVTYTKDGCKYKRHYFFFGREGFLKVLMEAGFFVGELTKSGGNLYAEARKNVKFFKGQAE